MAERRPAHFQQHKLCSWIKRDQFDVTCFFISLFTAQHVSEVNTSILRSLRIICWVISWVVLLWFDACWCYVVVWLGCWEVLLIYYHTLEGGCLFYVAVSLCTTLLCSRRQWALVCAHVVAWFTQITLSGLVRHDEIVLLGLVWTQHRVSHIYIKNMSLIYRRWDGNHPQHGECSLMHQRHWYHVS